MPQPDRMAARRASAGGEDRRLSGRWGIESSFPIGFSSTATSRGEQATNYRMVVAIRKAAATAAIFALVSVLAFQGFSVPAHAKKITRSETIASLAPGSFEAFMEQIAGTSTLPRKILTEGRSVGLKLVRCTRVDLDGEWPVGRMAKITGSGWTNTSASLRIGIWPEQPASLFDLNTKEGMKRKAEEQRRSSRMAAVQVAANREVDAADDRDDRERPNPTPPEVDTADEKIKPKPTPPEPEPTPPEPTPEPEPSPPEPKPTPPEIDTNDEKEIDTGDIKERKVLVLADHAKDSDEKLRDLVDEPNYKEVRMDWEPAEGGHGELMPSFVSTNIRSLISGSEDDGPSVIPAPPDDDEKRPVVIPEEEEKPPPDEEEKEKRPVVIPIPPVHEDDEGGSVLPIPTPPDEEHGDDHGGENVIPLPRYNLSLEVLRRLRRQARGVMTVARDLTNRQLAAFLEFLDGKTARVEKLKSLISENLTMKGLPSDEALQAMVKLLNKKEAHNEAKTVSTAKSAMVSILPVLLQRKAGVTDGSAQFAGELADPGIRYWRKRENRVEELEDWKPIFGFEIQRFPLSDAEVEKEVDKKMARLLPLIKEKSGNSNVDAAKDIVEDEARSEIRITGPVTCTTFVVKSDGSHKSASQTETPMINSRRGFMVVITRTLDGYEFDLYGWTTEGSKSSWKSVHVDNVPVERITTPRVIMAESDAAVKSLRYYVSKDMEVNETRCDKVVDHADCTVSEWTSWTPCTTTCGLGEMHRARMIVTDAIGNGKCDQALSDVKLCNADKPCSKSFQDCQLSAWSHFSQCDVTCGNGTVKRTREIVKQPEGDGLPCGTLTNTVPCHNNPCPEA